ncbi:carboxymethylenebutenolidase [Neorhizobium galegae]|uniref:dienelactone hydrolase family protein n=1 Tax=Neorhizobium galegae TaxID=399 RepID=UPI001AE49762|nr:dienelactone hydrolase family protein [Neorhizobium galegae]MBP2562512.1 carboxymethylenebutenolidase [Neorhizobium galegae]
MSQIELKASDGHTLGGYEANPTGKPRGGIVVVQEIFGVNSHIRSICDRFAAEGYVAIAPAIFDRFERDFETGYTPENVELAKALIAKFDMGKCLLDVAAAREAVGSAGKIGIVGFCLGGSVAFATATRLDGFSAATCFYGGMAQKFAGEKARCPVQFHFGADDASIPPENYLEVKAKQPGAEFYVYENAGHGFHCDARGSYTQAASALAWQRTLDFFARRVAAGPGV